MRADLLIEIGTEEIPAGYIEPAVKALSERTGSALLEKRIESGEITTFATPRRLALQIKDVALVQRDESRDVSGPPKRIAYDGEGNPTKAAIGFASTNGVSVDDLRTVETPKGEYLTVTVHEEGRPTSEVIGEILPEIVGGLPFPKTMRWEETGFLFARPVRWLIVLHGEDTIGVEIAGVKSGRESRGHRILHPQPVRITDPRSYESALEKAFVVPSVAKRKRMIAEALAGLAVGEGGHILDDPALLDQVTNLVEFPHPICGSFDVRYTALPDKVVITAMRSHQRYFSVIGDNGALLPRFVTVANGTGGNEDDVRVGNERVLAARLSDAEFYWNEDRSIPLADRVELLGKLLWQEGLGSMLEKTARIEAVATEISARYAPAEKDVVSRAARLSKADLTTEMIRDGKEFTALQGYMGMEYALASGEDEQVASTIFEQYLPRFSTDELPTTGAGSVLSLADRIDTLLGCVSLGQMPTGSQDPYALRRHARAILRILLEEKVPVPLSELIAAGLSAYGEKIVDPGKVASDATGFMGGRLKNLLTEKDYPYDVVDAVLVGGLDSPADVEQRVAAIRDFRETDAFADLVSGFKRVVNILKKAEGSSECVDDGLLKEDAEKALHAAVEAARGTYVKRLAGRDYRGAMECLLDLRTPIDDFFDKVLVMDEDAAVRANRIALLGGIAHLFGELADLSKVVLEGDV